MSTATATIPAATIPTTTKPKNPKSIIKEKDDEKISLQEVFNIILEYLGPGIKYVLMIGLCIFIGAVLYTTVGAKQSVVYLRKYVYIMAILLPLLFLVYLFMRKDSSKIEPKVLMTIGGIVVFLTITIILSYFHKPSASSTNSIVMQSYIINLILIAIAIVALAIGYNVLKNSAKRMRGWPGFIVNFLFFIPCLLSDFVDYIVAELKHSPPSVYILFIIEIILILAYIYVPKILKMLILKNGVTLQDKPVYLNKVKILSNSDIFLLPNTVTSTLTATDIQSSTYNSNFGLSMWIYVNNMGTSKLENNGSMLFQNSSPNNENGKPSIQFMGGNDEWKFTFTDQLIKYNIISSENPSYLQLSSPDITSIYPKYNRYVYKNRDNNLYTISETLNFLKDASDNKEDTINSAYKQWLDNEKLGDYSVTYTYSYGANNFSDGKKKYVDHSNNTPYSTITEVLNQIKKDYDGYKIIADKRVDDAIRSKVVAEKDADRFSLDDMYSLVTKITQTVKYKGENSFRLTIPSQKWNHIIFNYYQNTVDLFINGNLERSMNLKNSPIRMLPTDIISVGELNGVNGAICNIVYYAEPLTKTKISHIYNTNFMKNPPIS